MMKRYATHTWLTALLAVPLAAACGSSSKDDKDSGSDTVTPGNDGSVDTPPSDVSNDSPTDTPPGVCTISPQFNGGMVTTDLVLTKACSPYSITEDIRVEENATLTIQPGVTLKFAKSTGLVVGYSGAGKLVAEGTASEPIVMTSGAASPAAGDWSGVTMYAETMTGIKLNYVSFDYCGEGSNGSCVKGLSGVKANSVTIDHATFGHVGATADAIVEDGDQLNFTITNSTFATGAITAGQYAIKLEAGAFAGVGAGNTFNGAPVNIDGGYIKTNATWLNPGTPIVVTGNVRVEGDTSPVLTVAAGTTFQFGTEIGIWVGYSAAGQLVAEGTATAPIVFTSKATTPGPGDWDGISLWSGTANGTKLAYAKLDYCGSDKACVDAVGGVKSDRVTIDHVTIDHVGANANGINEADATSRIKISNSTFPAGAIQTGRYAISLDAASFAAIGTGNTFNGAMIEVGGGYIQTTTTWNNPGTAIAVTDDIRVEGSSTPVLTINAGMTFKFAAEKAVWVAYSAAGKLVVTGTSTSRVVFTSLASSPGKGDWQGIVVWNAGQATIAYADILYAGGYTNSEGGVVTVGNNSVVSLSNSAVNQSGGYGVYVDCGNTHVTVTSCTFTDNTSAEQGPGPAGPDC